MTSLEIIDGLCAVTQAQSEIIRDLATFIEEQMTVDEAVQAELMERCSRIESEQQTAIEKCYPPLYSAMQKGGTDG